MLAAQLLVIKAKKYESDSMGSGTGNQYAVLLCK
jgi:hypothetical protein